MCLCSTVKVCLIVGIVSFLNDFINAQKAGYDDIITIENNVLKFRNINYSEKGIAEILIDQVGYHPSYEHCIGVKKETNILAVFGVGVSVCLIGVSRYGHRSSSFFRADNYLLIAGVLIGLVSLTSLTNEEKEIKKENLFEAIEIFNQDVLNWKNSSCFELFFGPTSNGLGVTYNF